MKRINYIGLLLIIVGLISCGGDNGRIPADVVTNPRSANGTHDNNLPVIEFETDNHDFGKLVQGEIVSYNFKFTNTGKSDLLISQVNTSCGCTVTDYTRDPVKPGEHGTIKATFDSTGRKGVQNKTISVVTNCQPNRNLLRIKAMVLAP
jgi:hypothetical protein